MDWYIGTEWKQENKGLRKKVLNLKFQELQKPHQVSKCIIQVKEINNLNGRPSKYLCEDKLHENQELTMGTALTPVDYYLEYLVQQMIKGEEAHCFIRTRTQETVDDDINFVLTLEDIKESREIFKLNVKEMYELALSYKENGVKMFKDYPKFAHDYFSRAAKYLMSYKPFKLLTLEADGIEGSELEMLFIQIQTNLAACLLNEKRYEDVIYMTEFVETNPSPTEKSIYRRAVAFYNIKEFEKAQELLEKVPHYKDKKDFAKLHQDIKQSWTESNNQYKDVVKRMFKKTL